MLRKNIDIMAFLAMIAALLSVTQPAYASVTIMDLGALSGGSQSYANGINDTGGIVGYSRMASGTNHAFLWQNGVMTDLGTRFRTGGSGSYANGINDIGAIAGYLISAINHQPCFGVYNAIMRCSGCFLIVH